MFCTNCGSPLVDGAKFCSECGARVSRPEPEFRTFADIEFPEPEEAKKTVETAPAEERPARERVSFDWSNVVDEPRRKDFTDIKSPWGTTGNIDEKELFAEMSNPGGKSRTMSFIDVLKAEKEERERAAADKAIEYTEVLHFDNDLGAFDEISGIQLAPLYDDVDEPVKTPFDVPDFKMPEPVVEDEPRFEEQPAPIESNGFTEPDEEELELSRETIAQFDEFVKSFEKEAGIAAEPEVEEPVFEEPEAEEAPFEEPVIEEPHVSAPKFELPDFLKKIADFGKEEPEIEVPEVEVPAIEVPEVEEPAVEEPVFEAPTIEIPEEPEEIEEPFQSDEPPVIELEEEPEEPEAVEAPFEEPSFEEPEVEEAPFEEPEVEKAPFEEPEVEEAPFEEPVFEEPKYDEAEPAEAEDAEEGSMEDLYLELSESDTVGRFGTRYELNKYDDLDDDDEDDEEEDDDEDEEIDENELFKEMEESSAERPSMTIAPPADKESEIEALRKRLAELTGVDMYAPADLEEAEPEEPEEEPAEEPVDELFEEPGDDIFEEAEEFEEEEPEEAEEPAEPVVEEVIEEPAEEKNETFAFEVEITPEVDELFASLTPASKAAIADIAFEPEVTPDVDALFEALEPASKAAAEVEIPVEPEVPAEPEPEIPAEPEVPAEPEPEAPAEIAVEDLYLNVEVPEELVTEEVPDLFVEVEDPVVPEAPAVEEVVEEAVEEAEPVVEEVIEEPAVEEPAEEKDTDALSLEELERDLFGDVLDEEFEAEETKKIDKFYTLYRKNEEFQRLLDEEYEKLKHGGGLTEEEKRAVDAIPKMADVEAATKAAVEAPAPAPAPAEPETPAVPVEKEKAYRQVEDETIYMPKEALEEQLKVDFTNATAAAAPAAAVATAAATAATAAAEKVPAEVPAEQPKKKEEKKKVEVEYEDVEHGSKFLTILAVIIALILIVLLAVILILQIAPDSAAAAWIDSLIENITSSFSMIPPGGGQFLL